HFDGDLAAESGYRLIISAQQLDRNALEYPMTMDAEKSFIAQLESSSSSLFSVVKPLSFEMKSERWAVYEAYLLNRGVLDNNLNTLAQPWTLPAAGNMLFSDD